MADDPQNPPSPPVPPAVPPGAAAPAGASAEGLPATPAHAPVSGPTETPAAAAPKATVAAPKPPAAKAAAAPRAAGTDAAAKAPAAKAAHEPPKPAPPSGPPDPPPPAGAALPPFIVSLQAAIPGGVSQVSYYLGDWTIIVPAGQLLAVARYLRDAPDALFDYCSDVTATDWPPRAERFDVLYMLYSIRHRHRVRVKVKVAEQQPIASVTGIWPAADWLEREVFDMFGVNFAGHPDRRRILMPEDWQGFPQRKDYPLEGPGELLMENPLDWLKLKQAREEADID